MREHAIRPKGHEVYAYREPQTDDKYMDLPGTLQLNGGEPKPFVIRARWDWVAPEDR